MIIIKSRLNWRAGLGYKGHIGKVAQLERLAQTGNHGQSCQDTFIDAHVPNALMLPQYNFSLADATKPPKYFPQGYHRF